MIQAELERHPHINRLQLLDVGASVSFMALEWKVLQCIFFHQMKFVC